MKSAYQFTYSFYLEMLAELKGYFAFTSVANALDYEENEKVLILRHDVDLCVGSAHQLAQQEASSHIKSTYMFICDCPVYSLYDSDNRELIREISEMGHEVGLHFDSKGTGTILDAPSMEKIKRFSNELSSITGTATKSISFHRPLENMLRGPEKIGDLVNAYSERLMRNYISDSKGAWRCKDPVSALKQVKSGSAQLLTHPIWWTKNYRDTEGKLLDFFDKGTKGFNASDRESFDEKLKLHLSVWPGREHFD